MRGASCVRTCVPGSPRRRLERARQGTPAAPACNTKAAMAVNSNPRAWTSRILPRGSQTCGPALSAHRAAGFAPGRRPRARRLPSGARSRRRCARRHNGRCRRVTRSARAWPSSLRVTSSMEPKPTVSVALRATVSGTKQASAGPQAVEPPYAGSRSRPHSRRRHRTTGRRRTGRRSDAVTATFGQRRRFCDRRVRPTAGRSRRRRRAPFGPTASAAIAV